MCTCFKKDIKATLFLGLQKNCGLEGGEASKETVQKLKLCCGLPQKRGILFENI